MEVTNPLLPEQRRQLILEIIKSEYTARSSQLSQYLKVSEMTIRRDLAALEHQGMVKRTHGGAVFRHERMTDKFKYQESKEENPEEKEKIAKMAAELIEPHDVVFIGEGTTASMILSYLNKDMPCSVFSNNCGITSEIGSLTLVADLVLMGGKYNPVTYSTTGNFTLELIERINANKVFLGVDAFSLRTGLTTSTQDIAAINRAMIRNTTGSVIIMSHHTKFGLVAAMEIAKPREIDILITDLKMPKDFIHDLKSLDIDIVMA